LKIISPQALFSSLQAADAHVHFAVHLDHNPGLPFLADTTPSGRGMSHLMVRGFAGRVKPAGRYKKEK
jgi:hypothetical protein